MLVAADIAKGDAADLSARHTLQIAGATSSTENRDVIATGSDEINRSFSNHEAIFIHTRLDENLVIGFSVT